MPESSGTPKQTRFEPPLGEIKARQMGELVRGDSRWDVVLETVRDPSIDGFRGRIHFICGNTHRLSAWIFLEWTEKEVQERFAEFATPGKPLWDLLSSLGGQ